MKTKTARKLRLDTTTLKNLTLDEVSIVVGGAAPKTSDQSICVCPHSQGNQCPAL